MHLISIVVFVGPFGYPVQFSGSETGRELIELSINMGYRQNTTRVVKLESVSASSLQRKLEQYTKLKRNV
jgi:hypothetical protein